jgi:hypothetical protein
MNFDFRITIMRKDKHSNFPAPNNFNGTGMTSSNHHHAMSFHDAAEQAFLK